MLFTKGAMAASLLALPLAASHPAKRSGSFRLPLQRRAVTDVATLGEIYSDQDWIVPVEIGGQTFHLQVDTGSSDTWLVSTLMPSDKQKQFPQNKFFDPSKSSTFQMMDGSSFNISYGGGQIFGSGKVGTDTIKIGSASVSMEIGLGTDCSKTGMIDTTYDGLLGLAFGAGNTFEPKAGPTFMEALQAQLDQPVFTFNLPASGQSQNLMEFGTVDHSLYKGQLQTAAINNGSSGHALGWLGTASLSVNGKNISSMQQQFLFDTGGLAGKARPDAVEAFWTQVNGAKDTSSGQDGTGWAVPCNSQVPDLTYDFVAPDGSKASGTVLGSLFITSSKVSSDNTMCLGALQSDGGSGVATVGYAFFHGLFTVFDQSKATVSFAQYSDASESGQAGAGSSDSSNASSSPSSTTATSATSSTDSDPSVKPTASSGASASNNSTTGSFGSSGSSNDGSATSPVSGSAAATPTSNDAAPKGNAGGRVEFSSYTLALAAIAAAYASM